MTRRKNHRAQREMACLNDIGIIMPACSSSTHVPHLGAPVFRIDLGLKIKDAPIGPAVRQTRDVLIDMIDVWNWIAHGFVLLVLLVFLFVPLVFCPPIPRLSLPYPTAVGLSRHCRAHFR